MRRRSAHHLLMVLLGALFLVVASFAHAQVEPLWSVRGQDRPEHLRFSPNGRWLVFGRRLYSSDRDWMTESVPNRLLEGEAWFVGNNLLLVREGTQLVLRHLPTLRPVRVLEQAESWGWMEVASSEDGNWIVLSRRSRSWSGAEVQLWQVKPIRLRQVVNLPDSFPRVSMNAAGSHFAYSSSSSYFGRGTAEVLVRSTANGQVIARWMFDTPVFAIALSPDARLIAIAHGEWWASYGRTYVSVYRVADRALLYRFGSFRVPCVNLTFSRDGRLLAGAAWADFERWFWALWRLSDGTQIAGEDDFVTQYGETWGAQFSPDGRYLYIWGSSHRVQVDTDSGRKLREDRVAIGTIIGFVREGQQAAVLHSNLVDDTLWISLHHAQDGTVMQTFPLPGVFGPLFYDTKCAISQDARYVAVAAGGLRLFEIVNGNATLRWDVPGGFWLLQFTGDAQKLFAHRQLEGTIEVYETSTGNATVLPLGIYVLGYSVSPNGSYLGVASRDEISIWRLSDLTRVFRMPVPTNELDFYRRGVEFSSNGEIALLWDDYLPEDRPEHLVKAWVVHLPTLQIRGSYESQALHDTTASLSSDGTTLVISSSDKSTFYAIPTGDGRPLRLSEIYELPIRTVQWFAAGGTLALINKETIAHVSTASSASIGSVIMDGWQGPLPEHLRYTLRNADTGEVVGEGLLNLFDLGLFSEAGFVLPAPASRLLLTINGSPFLRATSVVGQGGGFGLPGNTVYLYTGDIDGDNEITLMDFGLLVRSFGTFAGDDGWNIDADLDGDGEITLMDFAWLVNHFGLIGDE